MNASDSARDFERTIRLAFARELADGTVTERELAARKDVVDALRPRPVPRRDVRIAERAAMKMGLLDFHTRFISNVRRARADLLGSAADGPPRFLIRVDEFPDSKALDDGRERWLTATKAFHETLVAEGVPYLMSIVSQYTHRPLDPAAAGGQALGDEDRTLIEQMRREGVTFAQHGATHRTRAADPRHRSELCGLDPEETEALIMAGQRRLAEVGIDTHVFVPPFNRFDRRQFAILARHFDVIAGGPESVPILGLHGGPVWWGDAVYLPCYAPLYARAGELPPVIDRLLTLAPGTWVPVVLHVSWELHSLRDLAVFARKVAPYAVSWDDLLDAVELSRNPLTAPAT